MHVRLERVIVTMCNKKHLFNFGAVVRPSHGPALQIFAVFLFTGSLERFFNEYPEKDVPPVLPSSKTAPEVL